MRAQCYFIVLLVWLSQPALAGILLEHPLWEATVDAFVNASSGGVDEATNPQDSGEDNLRADAELRALVLTDVNARTRVGGRVLLAGSSDEDDGDVEIGEFSAIAITPVGRFELGERPGLPDVLTGFAPNNYVFATAEYGPSAGPSLDPGSTLPSLFLDAELAAEIDALSLLGVTSAFFFDTSFKAIYVAPKTAGFLAGVSFSPNANESPGEFDELLQVGLTYDYFWQNHQLHVGGTYAFASGRDGPAGVVGNEDINSLNLGATLTLDDAWQFGFSTTLQGDSGSPANAPPSTDDSWGWVASLNYNKGPWTAGGYLQQARSEGDVLQPGDDALQVFQVGLSYRATIRTRLFAALYNFRFDNEGASVAADRFRGNVVLAGIRVIL